MPRTAEPQRAANNANTPQVATIPQSGGVFGVEEYYFTGPEGLVTISMLKVDS